MEAPDKGWMSLRWDDINYLQGVDRILDFAVQSTNRNEIACPCVRCGNRYYEHQTIVRGHLIAYGMRQSYRFWYFLGETRSSNFIGDNDDELDIVDIDAGVEHNVGAATVDDNEPIEIGRAHV